MKRVIHIVLSCCLFAGVLSVSPREAIAQKKSGVNAKGSKSTAKQKAQTSKKPTVKSAPKKGTASSKQQTASSSTKRRSTSAVSKNRTTSASEVRQTPQIRLKTEELDKIRQSIREYEQKLSQTRKTERSTLEKLDTYEKQTSLLRTLVSQLGMKISENKNAIELAQNELETANRALERLKDRYAHSITNIYKRGKLRDTELLLSASSLNQMFIRSKYLQAFTRKHRSDADEIRLRQDDIAEQKSRLEEKLHHQQATMVEKKNEEQVLGRKTEEKKALLDRVRQDKDAFAEQLRRKQAAAAKIERLIADLVERERMKRLEAQRKRETNLADADRSAGASRLDRRIVSLPSKAISETTFGRLRGRLPWPVSEGAVVGTFGEQVNPRLGTVTMSNGIDIRVANGTSVRSVADGVVSMIYFIAGYGNLVIINHDDGFFTVYAHLAEIVVRDGQKVKAGQVIAKSGEGVSGEQIHFELWRERQKQNPLTWLAGR